MAEILATIVELLDALVKIKQYVIDPLKVQFRYLCCSNNILESLKAEVQRLENVRASLQLDVDAARRNLEIIGPDVEDWLKRVDKIKKETDRISRAISEAQQGCANGSCPNLMLRYSVSREATKTTKAAANEVQFADKFNKRVGHSAPPPGTEIIAVASGTEFDSRKTMEVQIMDALRDDSVYLIGICGMGGVGKTTMAKNIWKRAMEEKLFDMVAMVVISQKPDRRGIQREIAEALGLKLEQENESIRTNKIHTRLMQEKRILIIIDDVWKRLNLEELGIPSQGDHKGCKIILTSRDSLVCTQMDATKIFSLESLAETEAWALFKANANTCVDDCDLHQIAKDVAKECKGLPLALVTVGRALRDQKNVKVWEDALVQLQKSAPSNMPGVLEDVYQPLELSYKHLESDEARYLFLLCCLFPEDSRISLKCLLQYGVGLRIFSNVESLRQARNRVYVLVEILKSRNMLMDDGTRHGIRRVKMHDVIRDMAISIASRDKHVFMTSHDISEWPEKDSYENYTCISLTLEDGVKLPECINCPVLKMLRMKIFDWEIFSGQVPNTFFDRMRELNVLDMKRVGSLPSSLQSLTNLRTLRLRFSNLENVSMIGRLVKLEILDLRKSNFTKLPKEIGGLEKLKSLDLRWCHDLKEIAPGVISRLVRLEELFVLHSFENWEAEVEGEERRNASLVEVASLKKLTALQLHVPDPKVLPLYWPELERSIIWIGTELREDAEYVEDDIYCSDNNLILHLNETTPLVHTMIRKADLLDLTITEMGATDELIKSIQERNEHLRSLRLCGCHNMKYLANKNNVFPKLRFLILSNCRDLEGISSVRPSLAGSFDALEVLVLRHLCKLTHFWDQKHYLPNLRKVAINNCSSLQYVFLHSTAESAEFVYPIEFPNLKELSLGQLPSFIHFWKEDNGSASSHISESQFLFNQKVFASLVELRLSNINATKIFSSQIPVVSFNQLQLLTVRSCPNLKVIFSPPSFRNFRTLKELAVHNCLMLEEVVGKEDEESQAAVKESLFPELKKLRLSKLPNFETFCRMKNDIELPQLESITIEDCHEMETFSMGSLTLPRLTYVFGLLEPAYATRILFKKEVTFASLVELQLCNLSTVTKIFSSQIPIGSFNRLKFLEVETCLNLEVIFSPPAFRNFKKLNKLTVKNCSKLENVVGKDDEESQAAVKEILFPELKELKLSQLPNFKKFCHMTNDIDLPHLESITIVDCNQMETFSLASHILPRLTHVSGSWAPHLATQTHFQKEVTFESLVELELCNLGTATKIFSSQVPIGSFNRLELLEVESCPNLEVIFSPPAFKNFKKLSKLTVKNCPKLENVVGEDEEESQAAVKKTLFPELKELKLSQLPNFKKFCHMKNDMELPQLESITIVDCNQMETFSLGSLSLPRLSRVFGSWAPHLATQIHFQKEVTFANLVELKLCNLSTATKIFSSQISIGSVNRLELLKVESCPNLEVIFSPPAFRNFKKLDKLTVKNCPKLKHVIGEDDEESQAAVKETLFPELKELELSQLPNFKTFCHMTNDMELPQLESITIEDCHQIETFSLGSLSLPCLKYVFGLLEPDLAARILFKKETPRHEIHYKNNSFTLSARDLSISGRHEWYMEKDSSDNFIVVAKVDGGEHISGTFEMVKLSPETLYEVVFEIWLEKFFERDCRVKLQLTQSEGITQPQERWENLLLKPQEKWIEILAGEFDTGPGPSGDLEFSLSCGDDEFYLLLKGVTIRPKA